MVSFVVVVVICIYLVETRKIKTIEFEQNRIYLNTEIKFHLDLFTEYFHEKLLRNM
jgi:hypothetical protein